MQYDRYYIAELIPQQQFTTNHSWANDAETFSGSLLQDVLKVVCKNVSGLSLKALNNHAIDLDFNQAKKYQPILALSVNGKRLSVREKGPLWLIANTDKYKVTPKSLDAMMIWQLSDITITHTDEAS